METREQRLQRENAVTQRSVNDRLSDLEEHPVSALDIASIVSKLERLGDLEKRIEEIETLLTTKGGTP